MRLLRFHKARIYTGRIPRVNPCARTYSPAEKYYYLISQVIYYIYVYRGWIVLCSEIA